AKVTLTLPPNTAPVADDSSVTLPDSGRATVTLSGSDLESPAANLIFTIVSLPTRGVLLHGNTLVHVGDTFAGSPSDLTYQLRLAGSDVTDSFAFTVTDNGNPPGTPNALTSAAATVTI